MRIFFKYLLATFICCLCAFCSKNQERNLNNYDASVVRDGNLTKLIGRKIRVVDTLEQLNPFVDVDHYNSKSRTLVSMHIASCTPCLVKMKKWNELISSDSLFSNLNFVFYAKNDLTWYFDHQVKEVNKFPFKIFHDPADIFIRANETPELTSAKSILLNQNSEIVYAGNPMEIEEEYNVLIDILRSGAIQ